MLREDIRASDETPTAPGEAREDPGKVQLFGDGSMQKVGCRKLEKGKQFLHKNECHTETETMKTEPYVSAWRVIGLVPFHFSVFSK